MSERLAQRVALLATIDPADGLASATTTSDVIDAKLYDSLMFVYAMGATITSSSKYTLTVYKGTVATAASITSTVTSVTFGPADDAKQKIIDVDVSKEGANRYYKGTVVQNGATTTLGKHCLFVFGSSTRYHPATDNDLSSVSSITYA